MTTNTYERPLTVTDIEALDNMDAKTALLLVKGALNLDQKNTLYTTLHDNGNVKTALYLG